MGNIGRVQAAPALCDEQAIRNLEQPESGNDGDVIRQQTEHVGGVVALFASEAPRERDGRIEDERHLVAASFFDEVAHLESIQRMLRAKSKERFDGLARTAVSSTDWHQAGD